MGRRTIWANEEVIELSKQFVAATDEVWRLQNGDDPECAHFRKIAEVGHYRHHKSTRQGTYVCTPSGILLGSMNTHNAEAVLKMMRDALKKYAELDRDARLLAADADILPKHRWEESFQADGLDLTVVARDLPESCDPEDETHKAWNQDRIWFSKDEARKWLPQDLTVAKVGDTYDLPEPLVTRVVRFSIVDTVKGQTSYYSRDEVKESKIHATVSATDGDSIKLNFHGSTHAESPKSRGREYPHGIETDMLGAATWDTNGERFKEFELVALGSRWGRTVFNGRHKQLDKSPVGFVIRLTPQHAPLIAPSFLFAYRAGWVKGPGS